MKADSPCLTRQSLGILTAMLGLFATTAQAQGVAQCAQVPCDDVRTVAAASTGVPVEHDFGATAGTTYYVTLTDLGTQFTVSHPLASLKMAITANDALVSLTPISGSNTLATATTLVADGANAVSTNGVAMASFTAMITGTYRFHIVGAPTSGSAPGPIGLVISATQGGAALQSWSDSIGLPGAPPPTAEGILQQNFTVTTAGEYQISVTDLALPQALQGPPQLLVLQGGSIVAILPDAANNNALTKAVTLQSGTYQIFAVALAGTNASGGLFSASVIPASAGGGTPSFAWAVPVGGTVAVGGAAQLTTGTQYSLVLKDLDFPIALSQLAAVAVDLSQGTAAAILMTSGTQDFMAAGGTSGDTYQVYAIAKAAPTPGAGSYSTQILNPGGTAVTGAAQPVTTSTSALNAYSFTASVPSAGGYTATLTDLQFPRVLTAADFALVQGGAVVGTARTSPGSITATLAAGSASLTLLAFAQSGSGGSLVDLSVSDSSGNLVFDQPQGVGAAFKPTQISIATKGTYQFTLADLAWPASFSQANGQLTGVLTQGGNLVGEIFGGGTLTSISVTTPGNYYLSIIATPSGTDQAGTYALNVSAEPPAPVVDFASDAGSVGSGGTVHLIWTTTGATSCTGSGGGWTGTWTGAQATADTVTSPAVASNATFTLTCQGAGGTTAKSLNVTVAAASGGGGGAITLDSLLALLAALAASRRSVSRDHIFGRKSVSPCDRTQ